MLGAGQEKVDPRAAGGGGVGGGCGDWLQGTGRGGGKGSEVRGSPQRRAPTLGETEKVTTILSPPKAHHLSWDPGSPLPTKQG